MNTCSICRHTKVQQIEIALVCGVSFRDIAGQFNVSKSSVERHQAHVAEAIAKAKAQNEVGRGLALLDQLGKLRDQTEEVLAVAMDCLSPLSGELALKAIDRRHKQIEIEAKLTGEFQADRENEHDLTPDQLAEIRRIKAERGEESVSDNN